MHLCKCLNPIHSGRAAQKPMTGLTARRSSFRCVDAIAMQLLAFCRCIEREPDPRDSYKRYMRGCVFVACLGRVPHTFVWVLS